MKRLLSFWGALMLLLFAGVSALAATNAELVRIFAQDGTLYAYVDIADADAPLTKVSAKIGSQSFPASGALKTVQQASPPVYCMLLLDVSNSMPDFTDDILEFAASTAELAGQNTHFILATFGNAFEIVEEDIPADELAPKIAAMTYVAKNTRMYGGLEAALDYFAQLERGANELHSVIILTDAVVYNKQGGITYEELLQRIENSEVMLHSVGFGDDTASLDSLGKLVNASQGKHCLAGADLAAAESAADIWGYIDNLFLAEFNIADYAAPGGVEHVTVTFASGAELVCKAEGDVEILAAGTTAPGGRATLPPPGMQAGTPAQTAEQAVVPDNLKVIVIIAVTGGLGLAAIALVFIRRKKQLPVAASGTGIYMRLEVLQGKFIGKRMELNLVSEFLVGRDKSCAIAFNSAGLAPQNSRVFTANSAVYIEDLNSQHGTFVNGMRIEMANILRSGDEISIGDAVFKLKF